MKKILSLLLCLTMTVLMAGSFAFADEAAEPVNPQDMPEVEQESVATPEEMAADEEAAGPSSPYEQMMSEENLRKVEAPLSENGEVEIEDYSVIEIPENEVAVTDDIIESNISNMLQYASTTETITEGTVQSGDVVNINFTGKLVGEEEPFEGGSAEGYDLSLGSGMFIPGFEDQVIGHEIGETFDIQVTFPEDYAEELAGKDAVFTVTINHKSVSVVPELNDDFVKSFSAENLNVQLNTVDELRQHIKETITNNLTNNAIISRLQQKTNVISYNESQFNMLKEYFMADLNRTVENFVASGMEGYDVETIARMSGFADADSYVTDETMYYLKSIMMFQKIAQDKGIEVSDEDVNNYISEIVAGTEYTADDLKEMNGEAWVFLVTNLDVLHSKVLEALQENVVITPAVEETQASEETIPVEVIPEEETAE